MEERSFKLNDELVLGESLATVVTMPASQPRAPSDEGDAPVQLHSSSSDDDHGGDAFEFEFPSFVSRDSDSPAGTAAAADELFADGVIRPLLFYPVFGGGGGRGGGTGTAAGQQPAAAAAAPAPRVITIRGQLGRLFLEESRSSSTSSSSSSAATDDDDDVRGGGGLEGAPPESYCLWTPGGGGSSSSRSTSSSSSSSSPAHRRRPPRKSGSTGSMARWRRISELVVGRSHSDGKEKFMFFPAPPAAVEPVAANKKQQYHHRHDTAEAAEPSPPANGRKAPGPAEVRDAAHRRVVAYGGVVPPGAITPPRRTFLPYREELVGFFANVNGVTRSHRHPF